MWKYQGTGKVKLHGRVKKTVYDFFTIDSGEAIENLVDAYYAHWQKYIKTAIDEYYADWKKYNNQFLLINKSGNNIHLSSNVKTAMEKYNANCSITVAMGTLESIVGTYTLVINHLQPDGTYAYYQFVLTYPVFASSQETAPFRPDFSIIEAVKDNDKTIAELTQAIKLNPNNALAYYNRAKAFVKRGDYNNAIADHTKIIELDPNDASAYFLRGISYCEKGDYDNGIADLNKTIELDSNHAEAYFNRGTARYLKGDYDNAITDYNKAIELDPNHAKAYYNRGTAHCEKGDYDRAIADYTQALDLEPNDAEAYVLRGNVYYLKDNYDSAIADYTEALKLVPNYKEVKRSLKEARYAKGDAGGNTPFYTAAPVYEFDKGVDFQDLLHYNAYRPEREEFFAAVARNGEYFQYQLGPCETLTPKSYVHVENNTDLDKRIKDFMRDNNLSCCETSYPNDFGGFTYVVNYSFDKHQTFGTVIMDSTAYADKE